jgi:hypothetical protein
MEAYPDFQIFTDQVIRKHEGKENKHMKLIIAYIQPERLNDVKQALYAAEVYKMSVTNASAAASRRATTRPTAARTSR